MKKIIALLLGLLGLTANASAQSDSIKTVDAAQFAEFINSDSVLLVDVRTAEEYAAGHIANAKNIDVLKFDFKDQVVGHRDRYLDSLFRVDEPVRVPRGAYLYIKGWLPSI